MYVLYGQLALPASCHPAYILCLQQKREQATGWTFQRPGQVMAGPVIVGLDSRWHLYAICSIGVETIGEAFSLGWRVGALRPGPRGWGTFEVEQGMRVQTRVGFRNTGVHARPGVPAISA